jgi:hypothetical protein
VNKITGLVSANEQQYSFGVVLWQNIRPSEQKIDRIINAYDMV